MDVDGEVAAARALSGRLEERDQLEDVVLGVYGLRDDEYPGARILSAPEDSTRGPEVDPSDVGFGETGLSNSASVAPKSKMRDRNLIGNLGEWRRI